jgi:hypothetical protein
MNLYLFLEEKDKSINKMNTYEMYVKSANNTDRPVVQCQWQI